MSVEGVGVGRLGEDGSIGVKGVVVDGWDERARMSVGGPGVGSREKNGSIGIVVDGWDEKVRRLVVGIGLVGLVESESACEEGVAVFENGSLAARGGGWYRRGNKCEVGFRVGWYYQGRGRAVVGIGVGGW